MASALDVVHSKGKAKKPRVVNRWSMLDQQIVGATSLNTFKNGLD